MVAYIENIVLPFVEARQESSDGAALVIMDNFKRQVTQTFTSLSKDNNIHVCLLPPNTTDHLQPLHIFANKPAKDFLKQKFQEWYSGQIVKQLSASADIESHEQEPVDISLPTLCELGASWLVEMADYFANNPATTVNGFIKSGICRALDGVESDEDVEDDQGSESSTSEENTPSSEESDDGTNLF